MGCLEINWNIGILEYWNNWNNWNNWNALLRGFSSAVMPLFSKALPRDVLLSEALSGMALPLAGPSHLLKASIAGYFRLLASYSTLITRYLKLSHVISPNRIVSHYWVGRKT